MSNTSKITFRDDGTILVKDVRLSYPHLFEPWAGEPDKPKKFSGKFIMYNSTHVAEIQALKAHLAKLMQEAFKAKIPLSNLFLRNGDDTGKDEQANAWVISASEKENRPPTLLNKDRSAIRADNGVLYAGCYVDVLIRPWTQNNVHGKKINANLLAVQFRRDGDAFSESAGRPDPNDVFEDLSASEFDDGPDPFSE